MRTRQLLELAWRESRTARRRLALYMSSISLGAATLVAIDSFAANMTASVREQARALLGGDISLTSREPLPAAVERLVDSIATSGIPVTEVTGFASMALIPRSGLTRLASVRAVGEGYPFYGEITTDPAGRWSTLQHGRHAIVDPSLLVSLDARLGDTLALGTARFVIVAAIKDVPGEPGIAASIGPRVYIPDRYLAETGLLVFGSRAEYETLFRLPAELPAPRFVARFNKRLTGDRIRLRTVAENEFNLTESIEQLRDFLGIVGLIALLLGGIGVASGVHAFVTRKIDTVAVLRCLGATSRQILAIYVLQAAAMGLVGAVVGAALGIAVQFALPAVASEFLPVDVQVRLTPTAIILGLAVGVWVSLIFALRPLVGLRRVSPLQALRRESDGDALRRARRDPARLLVGATIVATVIAIAVSRAGTVRDGLWFSAGVGAAVGVLWVSAAIVTWQARRAVRARWPFVLRQGIASLYRPGNQTRAVALALGFGVFLMSSLYQVQVNLLRQFGGRLAASRANVVFFDIQDDQQPGVDSLVRAQGHTVVQAAPIVPMRIAQINGRSVAELLADTGVGRRRAGWALRREYRSTYRDTLVSSERLVAGQWFSNRSANEGGANGDADVVHEASFEEEVARELRLSVGDTVIWNVQGVTVRTRVASLREVNWARFEPNFFVVTNSAALAGAPKQFVILARVPTSAGVARLQRDVVRSYPNVSSLDLTAVQRTVANVIGKVTTAVRFMALLSLALAVPVLFSAVAATRRDRLREGVLLKTLGATRRQVGRIMLAEYAVLGILGSITGVVLSLAAAWALVRFVFEVPSFVPAVVPAVAVALSMTGLAVAIGVLTGREVFAQTPITALREV
ncbi:MAG: ABC transporter permease [Gemmatimonadaceae bacterium]